MQLQFSKNKIPCLRLIQGQTQTQEQTQELKLNEGMPDVGRILGTWAQPVIRGKEWRSDAVVCSCGVMVWVLYAPEDGSQAQCVESWIPFSVKWSIPDSGQDGTLLCQAAVKAADTRVLSGRKLMIRVSVCMTAEAYVPSVAEYYEPGEVPEDIQLRKKTYTPCLAAEAGEKAFMIDEELMLPGSAPAMGKMIRYSLQPEITERKVLGDKAVFRGNCIFHLLYRTAEGALASWDFEIPFSQYTELEREYGNQAQVDIFPFVTALETEMAEGGRIRLKAGLSGQYLLYDTPEIIMAEDAYSPFREVNLQTERVEIPTINPPVQKMIRVEQTAPFGGTRCADSEIFVGCPSIQPRSDRDAAELNGIFQVLYYDTEGQLQSGNAHYQQEEPVENGDSVAWCVPKGRPQIMPGIDSTALKAEVMLHQVFADAKPLDMLTGLTIGDQAEKDPARPSLILRRPGQQDLWTLAKENGSTEDAIRQANHLQGDPEPDQMLLIPVL